MRHRTARRSAGATVVLLALCCALLGGCAGLGDTTQPLSGHLSIDGSTALQPLATKAAALFTQHNPQVHIDVSGGGSLKGVSDANAGNVDIGDSDVYADPALYPDPNLTDHLVAVVPFTMITNLDVDVKSLSQAQIIAIYSTSQIRNWKDVGGPDMPIVPVVRPMTSGTRATFRKYVLGGRDQKGTLLQSDSSQTVLQTVAQTPGAIGYLGLAYLDSTVNQVAIDNKLPTPENIHAGSYAFWGFEHMYTLGDANPLIEAFLTFMVGPEVQQLASQLSYIPIADAQLASVQPTGAVLASAFVRRESEVRDAEA
jgi:phosphate transport system substrate-binding protein